MAPICRGDVDFGRVSPPNCVPAGILQAATSPHTFRGGGGGRIGSGGRSLWGNSRHWEDPHLPLSAICDNPPGEGRGQNQRRERLNIKLISLGSSVFFQGKTNAVIVGDLRGGTKGNGIFSTDFLSCSFSVEGCGEIVR